LVKSHTAEQIRKKAAEREEFKRGMASAMGEMLEDLRYPISRDGSVLDTAFIAPLIAYHLVRCGWRQDPDARIIKSRKVVAKGVVEDAVEWVSVDEPDDPLENLENMTLAEINALSPNVRAEALRRMGGPETPDLPTNPGWHVSTSLNIEQALDTEDDGTEWTGRA
jgi:hypothetical protein